MAGGKFVSTLGLYQGQQGDLARGTWAGGTQAWELEFHLREKSLAISCRWRVASGEEGDRQSPLEVRGRGSHSGEQEPC